MFLGRKALRLQVVNEVLGQEFLGGIGDGILLPRTTEGRDEVLELGERELTLLVFLDDPRASSSGFLSLKSLVGSSPRSLFSFST